MGSVLVRVFEAEEQTDGSEPIGETFPECPRQAHKQSYRYFNLPYCSGVSFNQQVRSSYQVQWQRIGRPSGRSNDPRPPMVMQNKERSWLRYCCWTCY